MARSKEEIISEITDLLEALLESGLDEDSHYYSFTHRTISGNDILNIIQDIEAVDNVISNIRPVILTILRKTAQDYIKDDKYDGLTGKNLILKEEDDRIS